MMVGGEGGSGGNQDFDLNLAPIIDCFTVLITYLLVSASFIALSSVEVGVSANGEASAAQQDTAETPINMELTLAMNRSVAIHVTGGPEKLDLTFPVQPLPDGSWNLAQLSSQVNDAKTKWPSLQDASLNAEPGVRYKEMIKVISELKKLMPKIYISG